MAWWRTARFGMFIHWGIYSVPAGTYHGQRIAGIGEWIMNNAYIPVAEYASYANDFTASNFDADEWVSIAKNAGMKYIVITSKHHDGFAMFHTKVDGYNIYDATPFHRDPLAELAAACQQPGNQVGLLLFPMPGLASPRWLCHQNPQPHRRTLGSRPGRRLRRLPQQRRRTAGPRAPHQLRPHRRPLVRHRPRHDPRPRRAIPLRSSASSPTSSSTTASAAASTATPKPPNSTSPPRLSRPRLGNLHDHQRHLGL